MINIFIQENAVILAAYTRFVELGQEAAEKVIAGREPKKEDKQAQDISRYLKAYQSKASLDTKQLEAVLYALLDLSDANSFPTVNPLVGPPIIYIILSSGGGGGGGGGDSVFPSNVTFVLAPGKSFGKYINGQTALWAGLTAVQAILDAAIEYLAPVFSAFSVTGQATTVEVGTTLSGSKTFTWTITLNSGTVATIDIYDNTAVATLLAGTANDGSQAIVITTIQLNANGSTQSWKGVGHDTGSSPGDFNSANFVVTSRFFRFYGPAAASVTNSAQVRALASSAFQTGAGAFNLDTGTSLVKFIVALPPGVTIVSVIDLDALDADITSQYVAQSNINVLDAGGTNRSYNIYEMNIGVAYSTSHRHQITTT